MTEGKRQTTITIEIAASRTGLSRRTVRRYIRRGLVNRRLNEKDLAKLRRIRRLTELQINLAGVEVILHMRRQIKTLRAEIARLRDTQAQRAENGRRIEID